jgi:hypothetical protein
MERRRRKLLLHSLLKFSRARDQLLPRNLRPERIILAGRIRRRQIPDHPLEKLRARIAIVRLRWNHPA